MRVYRGVCGGARVQECVYIVRMSECKTTCVLVFIYVRVHTRKIERTEPTASMRRDL